MSFIVFRRLPGGLIRVITVRDMDDIERRLFPPQVGGLNEEETFLG
jgi:hypothetical protein